MLGLLVLSGNVAPWQIYLTSGVNAVLGAFDASARRALYPALVPRSELQNASTLNASAYRLGRLAGPAVAGFIIASFGPAMSYFVNAATYGAFIYALLAIRVPSGRSVGAGSLWSQMVDGVSYTLRTPVLGWLMLLESVYSLFGINLALITIVGRDVLNAGPEGIGLLLGSLGAGTIAGTALLILVGEIERKGRLMLASGAIYAGMFLLFGGSSRYELSLALLIGLGATDAIWSTMRTTIFQLQADDIYRGRTMSVLLLAGRGLGQAGQFESGLAAAAVGPALACVVGATMIGGSVLIVNAVNDRIRLFRAAHQ
jgi:hypothetical protein